MAEMAPAQAYPAMEGPSYPMPGMSGYPETSTRMISKNGIYTLFKRSDHSKVPKTSFFPGGGDVGSPKFHNFLEEIVQFPGGSFLRFFGC